MVVEAHAAGRPAAFDSLSPPTEIGNDKWPKVLKAQNLKMLANILICGRSMPATFVATE